MKKYFIFFILILFVIGCSNDPYKYKDLGLNPSNDWINKTVKVTFGKSSRALDGKSFIVKIKNMGIDQRIKPSLSYFETYKTFTDDGHKRLYFHWFKLGKTTSGTRGIISCKEAILKKK